MKTWHWLIVLAVTALVCLFIGRATRKVETVTVKIPNDSVVLALHEWGLQTLRVVKDLRGIYDTWEFVSAEGETIRIAGETKYKDVPVVEYTTDTSLTIFINKKPKPLPLWVYTKTKGEPIKIIVGTRHAEYAVDIKKPVVDFYGTMSAMYTTDKTIRGDLDVGIMFWDRIGLLTHVDIDHEKRANFGVGVKVRIF